MQYFFEHFGLGAEEVFQIYQMGNSPFPPHLHRAYELACVRQGSLALQIDQKKYILESGELAFIACNQIHSYTPLSKPAGRSVHSDELIDAASQRQTIAYSDTVVSVLIFSPEIIGSFYQAYKGLVPVNNIIRAPEWLDFNDMENIYRKKGVLYTLCDLLLSVTKMEPSDNALHWGAIQQVFAYIDRHYGEECSLRTVAKALQYDYKYLSKLFSKYSGISFTQYLNNYRISQACAMLHNEKMTVTEIADKCGYENLRTFHRNFLTIMRCSPQMHLAKETL